MVHASPSLPARTRAINPQSSTARPTRGSGIWVMPYPSRMLMESTTPFLIQMRPSGPRESLRTYDSGIPSEAVQNRQSSRDCAKAPGTASSSTIALILIPLDISARLPESTLKNSPKSPRIRIEHDTHIHLPAHLLIPTLFRRPPHHSSAEPHA